MGMGKWINLKFVWSESRATYCSNTNITYCTYYHLYYKCTVLLTVRSTDFSSGHVSAVAGGLRWSEITALNSFTVTQETAIYCSYPPNGTRTAIKNLKNLVVARRTCTHVLYSACTVTVCRGEPRAVDQLEDERKIFHLMMRR